MRTTYAKELQKRMDVMESKEVLQAGRWIGKAIQHGGIIHLFGCGHSHLLTLDVFYRAGGLVPISPILHEPLMLHEGAVRSSQLERKEGYADTFLNEVDFQEGDLCIVISTSGRNPVPIDVAMRAKEKGIPVIVITSKEYSLLQPSRHSSGKRLYEVGDLVIDNASVPGDAVLQHPKVPVPFTPTSTVIGAAILQAMFAEAIGWLADQGIEAPIFLSGNIEGADDRNEALIARYGARIPLLIRGLG